MLGQQIASLFVKLGADTRGLKKGMDEAATMTKRQMAKLEQEQKRAADRRNTMLTGAAIAGFYMLQRELTKSVKLYMEAEKADIRLAQTIRSLGSAAQMTAPQLAKLTDELFRTTTFDDEKIKGAETVLLRFGQVRKDMFRDVLKLAADMARADGDIEGAALSLGRALEDPADGLARLKREGVNVTDALVNTVNGLMKLGKIAEAQEVIMSALNAEFGGQAQAQLKSFAGEIDSMSRAWGEWEEGVGRWIASGAMKFRESFHAIFDVPGGESDFARDLAIDMERVSDETGVAVTNLSSFARAGQALAKMKADAKAAADEAYRLANGIKAAWTMKVPATLEPFKLPPKESYDEHIRQLARVKGEYVDAAEAAKVFHETELKAMAEAQDRASLYADAIAGLSDTFFEMARDGKNAMQILADYFSRLIQQMISELVRLQAYKWFFNMLKPSVVGGNAAYVNPASPSMGSGGAFPSANYSSVASGITVNVIDQRIAGSPAITAQQGAGGSIEIIVGDALTSLVNKGKLDKVFKNFGASRVVTVG